MFISSSISSIKQKDLSILGLSPRKGLHTPKLCAVKKEKEKSLSRVRLFATLWNLVRQAPLATGFSKQEYWSGVQSPSPGIL